LAKSLFENALPQTYLLKYKDDEGDFITVSSDRELTEAFRLAKEQDILRFSISSQQQQPPQNSSGNSNQPTSFFDILEKLVGDNSFIRDLLNNLEIEVKSFPDFSKDYSSEKQEDVLHNAYCDGCNVQIKGIRYKCKSCLDYDLCEKCFNVGGVHVPAEHQFDKILRPIARPTCPFPRGRGCSGNFNRCPMYRNRCNSEQVNVPQSEVIHPATCDGCSQRVKGLRYKCNSCMDFDLCQTCKDKNVHSEHTFTTFTKPVWTPPCPQNTSAESKQETPSPVVSEKKPDVPVIPVKKVEPVPEVVPLIPLKKAEQVPAPAPKVEFVAPKVEVVAPKVEVVAPKQTPPQSPVVPNFQPVPVQVQVPIPPRVNPEPITSSFEQKLKQLAEMGFTNRERNIKLLVKYNGDMLHVVKDLLDV